MSLAPGDRLGPYEILSSLGAGGMGAVYRARDPRLQRDVAIKVLHPDKLTDAGRRDRFLLEAKAVSSLNHPNILTVYDTGAEGEVAYLVTELVDGRPLDALIPSSGYPVAEVLRIATQIADALALAHASGIIHRDLKPANVMLTGDGRVKVLDFGLAKILGPSSQGDHATQTMVAHTAEGTVMGTAGYMSPEQAEGKPLDQRSDIFSFGALLYELATGQRAFPGQTQMSMIAAVLREEPIPPNERRADLPPELTRIIMRCLRKDPARRVQSTADLKVALEELKHESDSGKLSASIPPGLVSGEPRTSGSRKGLRVVRLLLAVVLVAGVVAVGVVSWRALTPAPSTAGTPQPVPLTTYQGNEDSVSFSPDGNQVAFAWSGETEDNYDIYVKLVGAGTPLRLTTDPALDFEARWSPDGQRVAFLRLLDRDTVAVLLISPLGGHEQRLGEFFTRRSVTGILASICWTPDSRYLLVSGSQTRGEPNAILRVAIETRATTSLATVKAPADGFTSPEVSPDGRTLAAVHVDGARTVRLFELSPAMEVTEPRGFDAAGTSVGQIVWSPDGNDLLFSHAVNNPLPLYRVSLSGGPPTSLAWTGAGAYSPAVAAQSGRVAFTRVARDTNIWQATLDASRRALPGRQRLASSSFREVFPQFSPDGRRLAFFSNRSGSVQIWTADATGSRAVPLSRMGPTATTGTPRWSPDGTRISFDSSDPGSYHIYVISADGGQAQALTSGSSNNFGAAWSPDGRWLYFSSNRSGEHQVWRVPPSGGAYEQVTRTGGQNPTVSPDGAWLYYTKSDGVGGLWRMPIGGGAETRLAPALYRYNYAIVPAGVFYVTPPSAPGAGASVQYHDLASGATTEVLTIDKPPDLGLAISPDGRTLLYTQVDYSGQDLMLVEGFR